MPTLIAIDSFQHRVLRVANAAIRLDWYRSVTDTGTSAPSHGGGNITFDTGVTRTAEHACSLKLDFLAARAIQVRSLIAAGIRDANVSFYFRTVDGTNPASSAMQLFQFGSTENGVISINTSGQITAKMGAGTTQTDSVDVCDGAWHRIDARCQTSTATGRLDVQVDGTALTQATDAITAADITDWNFGHTAGTVDYTVYVSDFVMSATGADYPMGDHICKKLEINGTGTHSKGSGAFTDQTGATTDAALLAAVDDAWDGTTPELSQTGDDYTTQTANDGAGYVEFTLADPSESTIWGAQLGTLMAALAATTADNGETRLVDSGGSTLATTGLIDPSGSATVYNGYRIIASAPGGGWDGTALTGVKVRFGFSTDAAPDVLFNSGLVEYAAPWSAGQTVTAVALEVTPSLPTGTVGVSSVIGVVVEATPSLPTGEVTTPAGGQTVTGVVLTVTPSLPTGVLAHTLTGTALSVTPSLPTGSLKHSLTGSVLTVTPTVPAGSLKHSLTGVAITATPSLPTGALKVSITGIVLTATPTLPAGQVTVPGAQTVTGVVLTITPTLPVGALAHTLTGVVLTTTPTLPVGTLNHGVTGTVITVSPTLPIGSLSSAATVTGVVLVVTVTLPIGAVTSAGDAVPVKGPTRKGPLAGNDTSTEELAGAPRSVLIGAGSNSMEEV